MSTRRPNPLRNLSQDEAKGRTLKKPVQHKGRGYEIRWKVLGFTDTHFRSVSPPTAARRWINRTGQAGGRFVVIERLDHHSKAEPRGFVMAVSSEFFTTWRGTQWELEPEVHWLSGAPTPSSVPRYATDEAGDRLPPTPRRHRDERDTG